MNTALIHSQATFFDNDVASIPPPAMRQTRRFAPATPSTKLRFVPATPASREKLRFVPRPSKASRAKAPSEPQSMMRLGGLGIAALALAGSIAVTSSAPAESSHVAPAPVVEARADVTFAAELPAPAVIAPAPVAAPQVTRSHRASVMVAAPAARTRVDESVDELDDGTAVVAPVDGPRPNPF